MKDFYKIAATEYCRIRFSYKGPYNNLRSKQQHFDNDVKELSETRWLRALVDAVLLAKTD